MNEAFVPRNELERRLLEAQEGRISGDLFMRELLEAHVFMPVLDRVASGVQLTTRLQPLVVHAEDGTEVLVLFTSPERAKPFVQGRAGYEGGVLEQFKWVLETTGVDHGISLNPGWSVGLDLEPEMLRSLLGAPGNGEG
jgi:hypothetical protein